MFRYRIAGNFRGRRLSRIGKRWPFSGKNFGQMLKPIIYVGGYGTPKFHGENYHGWLLNCKIHECFLPWKFCAILYLILKQAQATRGGVTPSSTMESPLSTSWVVPPAESSTLCQDTKKTGFRIAFFGCVYSFMPCCHIIWFVLFLIWDSNSPTHRVIASHSLSATVICSCRTRWGMSIKYYLKYWPLLHNVGLGWTISDNGLHGRALIKAASHSGTFIWKNLDPRGAEKEGEMRLGQEEQYLSLLCTGCHGYKMCLRLYMDGDGSGKARADPGFLRGGILI